MSTFALVGLSIACMFIVQGVFPFFVSTDPKKMSDAQKTVIFKSYLWLMVMAAVFPWFMNAVVYK